MSRGQATNRVAGRVTRPPARMLNTLEIQIRLDSGRLMELEVPSRQCKVHLNEHIEISYYLSQHPGDLPLVQRIYSITHQRRIFP
jgi:hypothetical protein